ncbi:MAG: phosphoglucosamine mutase, partial [Hyphomonadaceae bacterium]|nr:phosphoglucosamine mutase [Hyphomonadaceae bacterium]
MTRYFGTDGIRGRANVGKLAPQRVLALGLAIGTVLRKRVHAPKLVLGRDTRGSGDALVAALTAGLTGAGVGVLDAGTLPTPGVSFMTQRHHADMGAMITASHNPHHDNGIKLFDEHGCKIGEADQAAIEAAVTGNLSDAALCERPARIQILSDSQPAYVDHLVSAWPQGMLMGDLKIVVDCAHGAAFETTQMLGDRLGLKDVIFIGTQPDGTNINAGVGSTHPDAMITAVLSHQADLGIGLDGDADRVLFCDETGKLIDGDQIMAVLARQAYENNTLKGGAVVATVMSNLGLERYVKSLGLDFIRTPVGDKHVAAHMHKFGQNVGGEQSGHILLTDFGPTSDAMLAALRILAALTQADARASKFLNVFEPVPQILKNIPYSGASPIGTPEL